MPVVSIAEWEQFISQNPDAHLLQTAAWGRLKERFGWESAHVVHGRLGAQVLFRRLPAGLSLAYIPKGPVGLDQLDHPDWRGLAEDLDALCRARRVIFLKIEPDAWIKTGKDFTREMLGEAKEKGTLWFEACLPAEAAPPGFQISKHSIQPRRTLLVDLGGSEEALLNRMKQKTRYNIRLAQRHGVIVSSSGDIDLFYRLMQSTGERDQFGIHSLAYYRECYHLFQPLGGCDLLIAWHQNQPLAALMVFSQGKRSWYFYGASSNSQRELMPTYLLQWEAMRWARRQGCLTYDLWGVPDAEGAELEAQFTQRSDGLWGVYRFKRGFGGALLRAAGPWDRAYQPWLYRLYQLWMKRRTVD